MHSILPHIDLIPDYPEIYFRVTIDLSRTFKKGTPIMFISDPEQPTSDPQTPSTDAPPPPTESEPSGGGTADTTTTTTTTTTEPKPTERQTRPHVKPLKG
jgi:hypothetical protein